jgi:hypothetical protein
MLNLILTLLMSSLSAADTAQDDHRVNHHLQRTQTKMQIDRDRTILENRKFAPPLKRSPTYQDSSAFRSYGVEMPTSNPFENLDLDHLDEDEPESTPASN